MNERHQRNVTDFCQWNFWTERNTIMNLSLVLILQKSRVQVTSLLIKWWLLVVATGAKTDLHLETFGSYNIQTYFSCRCSFQFSKN